MFKALGTSPFLVNVPILFHLKTPENLWVKSKLLRPSTSTLIRCEKIFLLTMLKKICNFYKRFKCVLCLIMFFIKSFCKNFLTQVMIPALLCKILSVKLSWTRRVYQIKPKTLAASFTDLQTDSLYISITSKLYKDHIKTLQIQLNYHTFRYNIKFDTGETSLGEFCRPGQ